MSVSRSDGGTSDQSSVCPPLCQLLGALCYSPRLCSRSTLLTPHRVGAQAVLGALWIITALLNLGLNGVIIRTGGYMWWSGYFRIWMAVLYILFGVSSVLSERYPRGIFVLLSGLLNLVGVALSITTIVRTSFALGSASWRTDNCRENDYNYNRWQNYPVVTESPDHRALRERCEEAHYLKWVLVLCLLAFMVTLSVLDLCLGLSSSVISFKSLKQGNKKSGNEPLLQETKE